jgi:hypothetical protein
MNQAINQREEGNKKTLKMDALYSFDFQQTIRRNIKEDRTHHNLHCESLKSCMISVCSLLLILFNIVDRYLQSKQEFPSVESMSVCLSVCDLVLKRLKKMS